MSQFLLLRVAKLCSAEFLLLMVRYGLVSDINGGLNCSDLSTVDVYFGLFSLSCSFLLLK